MNNLSVCQRTLTLIGNEVKQGVSPEDASYFLGKTYLSIVQDAERNSRDPHRFDELINEQTPGGLNEQVSLSLRFHFNDPSTYADFPS